MLRDEWRATVLPALRGDVLDVGAGNGHALPYLRACAKVTCIEPRPSRALREQAQHYGAQVDAAAAERLPYADHTFDAVICSAVLCSVTSQPAALHELRRVLRSGGSLVFFEHVGSAPGTWTRRAQRAIAPLSRLLDHGCDPSRDTLTALRETFAIEAVERRSLTGTFGFETVLINGRAGVP